jgi:hypothetical protein
MRFVMEQKTNNQERGRKYGGSSSYVDMGEPSKAPRQDEDGRDLVGSSGPDPTPKYNSIGEQGISNRPAEVEHAFPESDQPREEPETPDTEETSATQQGGNRGGV